MFIEPLVIIPSSRYINNWYHPEITELTKDLKSTRCGKLYGNLMRMDVLFEKSRVMHVVVITDDVGMEEMVNGKKLQKYAERLATLFNEKVWAPGDKQFISTEYGKIVDKMYPMYVEDFAFGVTPHISLETDGKDWWFI